STVSRIGEVAGTAASAAHAAPRRATPTIQTKRLFMTHEPFLFAAKNGRDIVHIDAVDSRTGLNATMRGWPSARTKPTRNDCRLLVEQKHANIPDLLLLQHNTTFRMVGSPHRE